VLLTRILYEILILRVLKQMTYQKCGIFFLKITIFILIKITVIEQIRKCAQNVQLLACSLCCCG